QGDVQGPDNDSQGRARRAGRVQRRPRDLHSGGPKCTHGQLGCLRNADAPARNDGRGRAQRAYQRGRRERAHRRYAQRGRGRMKVLIDTNILISAALSSGGTPFLAYAKAVTHPNHAVVCEQNIDELRRVFNRKFPTKLYAVERFLATALMSIEVVPVPEPETDAEQSVRDVADRPILRAAIASGVDVLLTGDKDFLESGIKHPKIMTAAEFLAMK